MIGHEPPWRVLVVDDSLSVARSIVRLLEDFGHMEVLGPAHRGAEALRIFSETHVDTVVVDFSMPDINGLEVLRAIRKERIDCLVIVMTNHASPSIKDQCLAEGADYFIIKSAEFESIPDIIHGHFSSKNS